MAWTLLAHHRCGSGSASSSRCCRCPTCSPPGWSRSASPGSSSACPTSRRSTGADRHRRAPGGSLVETAPLVDSAGAVLLIPYALALFPACAASALALRSRRAALPAAAAAAALVLALVLGVAAARSRRCSRASASAGSPWPGSPTAGCGSRPAGTATRPSALGVRSPGAGRRCAVVGLVAAASYAVVDMPAGNRRHVLREAVTPYDSAYLETPLSAFRRFRDQGPGVYANLADRKLFRVRGAGPGTRVRVAVLDRYDGTRWYADDDTSPDDFTDRFLRVSSRHRQPRARRGGGSTRSSCAAPGTCRGCRRSARCRPSSSTTTTPATGCRTCATTGPTDTAVLPGGLHVQRGLRPHRDPRRPTGSPRG